MKEYKKVLTIAGSDSGGGAGIQADIKTISACGCFATTAITAITAQNTLGVTGIHVIPTETVERQIRAVLDDIGTDAVKLGMLPSAETIERIAALLIEYGVENIVTDPVMVATSGDRLISPEAVEAMRRHIFPISTLLTPNIPEAEFLTGIAIRTVEDYREAALKLQEDGVRSVLIKSGHFETPEITDYLLHEGRLLPYTHDRIDTVNTHGTGCTLSSAIASYLALGLDLPLAVRAAEDFIFKAINNGKKYTLGKGHGPAHHFFRLWE